MSAEPDIGVAVLDPAWETELPDVSDLCRRAAIAALSAVGTEAEVEVSIALAGDDLVRQLNRDFRGHDKPTNVLSFVDAGPAVPGEPRLLGDVVLARETLFAEARTRDIPPSHHLAHLVVHGVLHLLGYDHEADAEADEMQSLETNVLATLNVPDPYSQDMGEPKP